MSNIEDNLVTVGVCTSVIKEAGKDKVKVHIEMQEKVRNTCIAKAAIFSVLVSTATSSFSVRKFQLLTVSI